MLSRTWRCTPRQIEVDVIENAWLHVRAQIPGDDINTMPGFELLNTLAERKLFCLRSRRRFEVHLHRSATKFDGTAARGCPRPFWLCPPFRSPLLRGPPRRPVCPFPAACFSECTPFIPCPR